jgi:hypothetical protein
MIAMLLGVMGGMALAAQDKYTVKVPNGLAFFDPTSTVQFSN